MPVSVGKNLKLVETDDSFVVDFQSNCEEAYNRYSANSYSLRDINGIIHGEITNNNYVVSGFSTNNYITSYKPAGLSTSEWEVVVKFTPSEILSNDWEGLFGGTQFDGFNLHISSGHIKNEFSSDGETWDIGNINGSVLTANTTYWVRTGWKNDTYYLDLSTNGETWTSQGTISSSTKIHSSHQELWIGTHWDNRPSAEVEWRPFIGSIDLNDTYIKINDEIVWSGCIYNASLYGILMSFASFISLHYTGLPSGASFEWFLPNDRILEFNSNNANIVERCNYTTLNNGITVSATANYGRASFLFQVKKGCKYTVDFDSEVNGGYKMVYFGNKPFAPGDGWDPAYGSIMVGGHKSYTFTATSDVLWIGIYASATTTDGTITLTNIKLLEEEASSVDVVKGSLIPYVVTFADTSKYISSVRANEDTIIDCTNMTSNTVILTINPDPIDATVVLEVEGGNPFDFEQVGNSITVSPGTKVRYTVSKTDYITQSNVIEVNETQTVEINLSETLYTYIIHPTPANATVTLTADGYTQEDNSISVPKGTTVEWSVSKTNYITQSGTKVVNGNCADNIVLKALLEFTITPTPSNATVTLIATGYSQVGNSIKVPYGTTVVWMVEKEGYETRSGSKIMTEDTEAQIILTEMLTLTIVPSPNDAIVHLTSPGYIQQGNSITVPYGTAVDWEVSKEGMGTKTGRKVVTETENMEVILLRYVTFTVTPTPSNATVELTAPGYEQEGNSITVLSTTRVHWKVYKSGYLPKSDYVTVNDDTTFPVSLTQAATLTINPTPADAIVTLTAEGYGQYGNKITVPLNTTVYWSVVKTGYVSQYGSESMTADKTKNITLVQI